MMNAFRYLIIDAVVKTDMQNIVEAISENSLLVENLMQQDISSYISQYIYDNHVSKPKLVLINKFTNTNKELLDNIFQILQNMDETFLRSEIKNKIRSLIDPNFQRGMKSTAVRATRAITNIVTNPFNDKNLLSLNKYHKQLKPIVQELLWELSFIDNADVQIRN